MTREMTREEAIKQFGEETVQIVECMCCEPTNTVGLNGECLGDEYTEWTAEHQGLRVYYYTSNEQDRIMAEHEDASLIDWEIDSYESIE